MFSSQGYLFLTFWSMAGVLEGFWALAHLRVLSLDTGLLPEKRFMHHVLEECHMAAHGDGKYNLHDCPMLILDRYDAFTSSSNNGSYWLRSDWSSLRTPMWAVVSQGKLKEASVYWYLLRGPPTR